MNTLSGKYFLASHMEYYRRGLIKDLIHDNFYLIEIFGKDRNTTCLQNIYDMIIDDVEGLSWDFFDTKEELEEYILWLDPPEEVKETNKKTSNIVKLVKDEE